tara:strand:+ start:264 stop:491 length:228 start_codon:yes stop_codon:yes gene_type:complete
LGARVLSCSALVERERLVPTGLHVLNQGRIVPHGGVVLAPRNAELRILGTRDWTLKEGLATMADDNGGDEDGKVE